jgi:DNA-binding PadR family transcriptional regulator
MFDWRCGFGHGWRHGHGAGRGAWAFGPEFMAAMWGVPGVRRGRQFRGGRMFEQGDLKYVILRLLDEKPRHGYEIIKELEERFSGAYSPSPGTVYPTLAMLEDLGYARARTEDGGKKIYEITAEGKAYLEANRGTVEDIFERIADFGSSFFSGPMMEVGAAFKHLGWAVYGPGFQTRDPERLRRVKEIIERAARDIEELGRQGGRAEGQTTG